MKNNGNVSVVVRECGSSFQEEYHVEAVEAVFGSRVRFAVCMDVRYMPAEDAENLAMALIVAAAKAREAASEPKTRFLPLLERFGLEGGAS